MKIVSILMFIFALSLLPVTTEARAHNKHTRKPASHSKHIKNHSKKNNKVAKSHGKAKPKRVGTRYH